MSPNNPSETELEGLLSSHLFVEEYDLTSLAQWCHRACPALERGREFKEQLHAAIQQPGLISPETYEAWTMDDRFPTQRQVQDHLKEIWNACFPDEPIS